MKLFCDRSLVFLRLFGLLMVLVLGTGCMGTWRADYSGLGLVPIDGTITLDGEPLADTVVFFVQESGTKSYATTDNNGFYRMKFNSEANGVLPGPVTVEISTTASTGELKAGGFEVDPDQKKRDKNKELVPAVYNKESQLKITVSSDDRTFNFDLKSDGSTTGPTE